MRRLSSPMKVWPGAFHTLYFTVFLRVHGTKDPCWPGADAAKPQISQQQRMIDDADNRGQGRGHDKWSDIKNIYRLQERPRARTHCTYC